MASKRIDLRRKEGKLKEKRGEKRVRSALCRVRDGTVGQRLLVGNGREGKESEFWGGGGRKVKIRALSYLGQFPS
jgi:hypothetical protein